MQQLQVDREEKVHTGFTTKVISVISDVFSELIKKYLPDPFLFAVILTIITGLFGIVLQNKTPLDMIAYWGQGFWGLLTFAMQMILVMIGGSVLAQAPIIQRFMDWFADIPKTPKGAIALATFFGGAMSYLNWGFGLIAGTLLAKKLAEPRRKRGIKNSGCSFKRENQVDRFDRATENWSFNQCPVFRRRPGQNGCFLRHQRRTKHGSGI